MIETPTQYSDGQKAFLALAESRGVDAKLFGEYVPEIKFREEKPDSTKPTIAYLHEGGTLMMVRGKQTGALTFEGAIDIPQVMQICDAIADIRKRFNIIGIFVASADSKEITPPLWTSSAAAIKTVYPDVEGVVIGHGTHTLEYAGAAAAYALQKPAMPIVFTASQIPIIGHPGSDGIGNLTGAMEIAANGDIAEVVAYANGEIFRATRVTKKNDSRLDLLESRVTGPLGYFTAGGIELKPGTRRRAGKRKHELVFQPKFSESVSVMKIQPGMNPETIESIIQNRRDIGIILETYGSGAIPRSFVQILRQHIERGFPIFLTSSCAESGISSTMQLHDEDAIEAHKAGIRNAGDMSTTAASVKLMHIFGNMPSLPLPEVEREMIGKSYAGEVTVKQNAEDF